MPNINNYSPGAQKLIRTDNTIVNTADCYNTAGDAIRVSPKFLDLGQIINGDVGGNGYQIAAGALVSAATMPLIKDCEWCRFVEVFYKNSGIIGELQFHRYVDETLAIDTLNGTMVLNVNTTYAVAFTTPATPQTSMPGRFAKLLYKNTGASAANIYMRVILYG